MTTQKTFFDDSYKLCLHDPEQGPGEEKRRWPRLIFSHILGPNEWAIIQTRYGGRHVICFEDGCFFNQDRLPRELYNVYIKSTAWLESPVRQLAIDRYLRKNPECHRSEIVVHHFSYYHLGAERNFEVAAMTSLEHAIVHGRAA